MTAEEFADYEWSRRHYYDWETTKYFMEKEKEEAEKAKEEATLAKEEAKLAKEETKLAKEKAKKAEDQAKKKEEEKLQMVRNFKSLNVSMDVIKQATGLTEEEINAL
jgi:membrane protein involved in colicin uptake